MHKMFTRFVSFVALFLFFFSLNTTNIFAHDKMYSAKQILGENVIIINYNVHDLKSGIPIKFNLRLYTLQEGRPVPFDTVSVVFSQGGSVKHSVTLPRSQNEDAETEYQFPGEGEYTLDADFQQRNASIAKASFPLVVEKGLENQFLKESFGSLVIFIVGVVVGYSVSQRKSFSKLVTPKS